MKGNKPAPAFDILDTFYDFSGHSVIVMPAISFKFSNGAIVDLSGTMIFPDDTQPFIGCLAFVLRPTGMPFSIFGNTQQISTEVTLVEKGPMVPVHLGHWSRLPNQDPLLGTNAGPGSSTNQDR
jgi:hypothetical protein